jgi:hypothetical protein
VKGNKAGFEGLADDSRELVYVIFCANRSVEKAEDVPPGLVEQLDRVLRWVEFKSHVMDFRLTHVNLVSFLMLRRLQKKALLGTNSRLSYGLAWMQDRYKAIGRSCSNL